MIDTVHNTYWNSQLAFIFVYFNYLSHMNIIIHLDLEHLEVEVITLF